MPGGKTSAAANPPSLEGFLSRRKRSIKHWLATKGVVTADDVEALVNSGTWEISPEFAAYMKTLVRVDTVPPPVIELDPVVFVEEAAVVELVEKPKRKEKDKREK